MGNKQSLEDAQSIENNQKLQRRRKVLLFVAALLCHIAVSFAFRLTGQIEQRLFNEILIYGGAAFAAAWALWGYRKSFLVNFGYVACLYLLSVYTLHDFINNGMAASEALEWGTGLFAFACLWALAAACFRQRVVRVLLQAVYYAGMVLTAALPMTSIGYGLISSGNALSSDLVLAVLQTNPQEALAYLQEQPLALWVIAWAILFLVSGIEVFLAYRMSRHAPARRLPLLLLVCLLLALNLKSSSPRLRTYYLVNTVIHTKQSMTSFKRYQAQKHIRLERLQKLKVTVEPEAKGVYVLVIGESASRDHMHTYGYDREDTPWMDKQAKQPGSVLFRRAYANYCQTIPALTYALSGKNQYNDVDLADACSLIEVAKAAGYDTYWISNQSRFNATSTPVSEMASTADHQVWINGRSLSPSETTYPDGEMLGHLPDKVQAPALIVLHLMGEHGKYANRYPKEAAFYHGKGDRLDGYDNAVRYVDGILQAVFEKARQYPDFKGFIYMPDHGEDPESGNSHQPDKFTYQMVHIPFLIWLDPAFRAERPQLYETLQKHADAPWTNDLFYDAMMDILGIRNAPYHNPAFSIASPEYRMTRDQLRTQHGARTFAEDPDQGLLSR